MVHGKGSSRNVTGGFVRMETATIKGKAAKAMIGFIRSKGPARIRIISGSMYPTARAGNFVVVRPVTTVPKPGDLLLCYSSGLFYMHRLIARRQDRWYLMGDNARKLDAPIARPAIIGSVITLEDAYGKRYADRMRMYYLCRGWMFALIDKLGKAVSGR